MSLKHKLLMLACVFSFLVLFGCADKQVQSTADPDAPQTDQAAPAAGKPQPGGKPQATTTGEALPQEASGQSSMEQAVSEITKNSIYFEYDSSDIKPESRTVLQRKGELLKKFPELKMSIEGHCDERGTTEYNLALGQRRAKAAQDFLVLLGIDAKRISIVSFGEERPADPAQNEAAYAKNRRDEFKIKD